MLENIDRRQIKKTNLLKIHTTKTKHNPEKANNTKHSKTKLAWSSRFLRHSFRKQGGLILHIAPYCNAM